MELRRLQVAILESERGPAELDSKPLSLPTYTTYLLAFCKHKLNIINYTCQFLQLLTALYGVFILALAISQIYFSFPICNTFIFHHFPFQAIH